MSIQSEITRITNKRDQALTKVASKGVTVPSGSTMDDLPDLIDLISVDETYSVTKSLTNVTTTVDDTKVIAGNSFFMDLTPDTGYAIRNITVTMGGVDITSQVFTPGVGERTIVSNGKYTASTEGMSGFSEVTVNVPNRYTSADEGKVVSSGALVAQTSDTVTQNGTVDTTLINSLTVNVSGGGGSDIEFVEYIQTDGAAWLDTGVKANQTSIINCVFYATAASAIVYGCGSSGNTASVSLVVSGSSASNCRFGNRAASAAVSINTLQSTHQLTNVFCFNSTYKTYTAASTFETPYSLLLGAMYNSSGGVDSWHFVGRIYHFHHVKGGAVVFDGRPAKKNGVYGVYDTVSQSFFPSITSTAFSGHDYS